MALQRWLRHRTASKYASLDDYDDYDYDDDSSVKKHSNWSSTVPGLLIMEELTPVVSPRIERRDSLDRLLPVFDRRRGPELLKKEHSVTGSFETEETEETEEEESTRQDEEELPDDCTKAVHWPDESGQKLAKIHHLPFCVPSFVRIVILLLYPKRRQFEFVQCEFSTEKRLTIGDMLRQLPEMATCLALKQQRYVALCFDDTELINLLTVQEYQLQDGDVLSAVPEGFLPRQIMEAASQLLSKKSVRDAIRSARISGRVLQEFKSSEEWAKEQARSVISRTGNSRDHEGIDETTKTQSLIEDHHESDCNYSEPIVDGKVQCSEDDNVSFCMSIASINDDDFHDFAQRSFSSFDSSYDLPDIDAIDRFLFGSKHFPNCPPSATLRDNRSIESLPILDKTLVDAAGGEALPTNHVPKVDQLDTVSPPVVKSEACLSSDSQPDLDSCP